MKHIKELLNYLRSKKVHQPHRERSERLGGHSLHKKNTKLERGRYFGQKWYPYGNEGED